MFRLLGRGKRLAFRYQEVRRVRTPNKELVCWEFIFYRSVISLLRFIPSPNICSTPLSSMSVLHSLFRTIIFV
jgi:hypothetical protein